MAYRADTLDRRILGPVITCITLGAILGGITAWTLQNNSETPPPAISGDSALFNDADYGPSPAE
ncbi:MAG: hypothetical protein Q3976_10040 [Corynebacterium sp.]|nr:hypothetical protein [Corynebacterium sp.]